MYISATVNAINMFYRNCLHTLAEPWGPVVLPSLSPAATRCNKEDHSMDTPWCACCTPQEIQTCKWARLIRDIAFSYCEMPQILAVCWWCMSVQVFSTCVCVYMWEREVCVHVYVHVYMCGVCACACAYMYFQTGWTHESEGGHHSLVLDS